MATATDVVGQALTKRGRPYVWGAKGPEQFDCSGLTWWSCRQEGIELPHGAQNQRDYLRRAGLLIPVADALRQVSILFRIDEGPSNDHVAFSLGNGSTMEAHSKAKGCNIFSATVGRRWTHAALIPGTTATPEAPAAPVPGPVDLAAIAFLLSVAKKRIYRFGDVDPGVKFIQAGINNLDASRNLAVDGAFGPDTWKAIVDLQRWFGLNMDGIVGPQTWGILYP